MKINLVIPPSLLRTLVKLAEVFVNDYHDLHREQLEIIRQQPTVDKEKLKSYYQSDRRLFEDERKREIEEAVRRQGI